jgi:AcrR family transcriptional regulator
MPRVGLDRGAVVSAAAELANVEGLDGLTLAALAKRLGVRSPSLYAHVDGLDELRRLLAARGTQELATALRLAATGRARGDALAAVADAYRTYAREHPGTYAALQRASDVNDDPASADVIDVVAAVLRGYGLDSDDAIHGVRIVRAALHGFVVLENGGGFGIPLDLDETFARLVRTLDGGIAASA